MPTHPTLSAPASARRGVVAWAWMLRWALVLLLVADQLGAPLHHHHHDSGIDGTWLTASTGQAGHQESNADGDEHDDHFGHATLAFRAASKAFELSALSDDLDVPAVGRFVTVLATLAAPAEEAGLRPSWRSPPIRSHRSLPPAGRAPPLHA